MKVENDKLINLLNTGASSRISDFSTEERKAIYDEMNRYGMNQKCAYYRFFCRFPGTGFEEWELRGIRQVIADFISQQGMRPLNEGELCRFYEEMPYGKRQVFWEYIGVLGISKSTCIYRMKEWNFKPWEFVGVRNIFANLNNKVA